MSKRYKSEVPGVMSGRFYHDKGTINPHLCESRITGVASTEKEILEAIARVHQEVDKLRNTVLAVQGLVSQMENYSVCGSLEKFTANTFDWIRDCFACMGNLTIPYQIILEQQKQNAELLNKFSLERSFKQIDEFIKLLMQQIKKFKQLSIDDPNLKTIAQGSYQKQLSSHFYQLFQEKFPQQAEYFEEILGSFLE
jgi:hypothetical protein